MAKLTENDLRRWLRNAWARGKADVGIQWIEPTRGSSIGVPDSLLPIYPALVPAELKLSKKVGSQYVTTVRQAQRRFHLMMNKQGMFSCYILAHGEQNNFEVWLAHNSFPAWERHDLPGEFVIASGQTLTKTIGRLELIGAIIKLMDRHDQCLIRVPNIS
jgi:hypothetical protein